MSSIGALPLCGEQVSGNMLADKLIVGEVLVERPDDIVTVAPCIKLVIVELVAIGLRESDQVQPMPSPTFDVMWRCQEPLNHPLLGIRRSVSKKCFSLLEHWWESDEIKRHAPKPGILVCRRCRLEVLFFQSCQDETVDGRSNPILLTDRRRNWLLNRPEGPEGSPVLKIDSRLRTGCRCRLAAGVGSAHLYPGSQVSNLLVAQFAVGRHLEMKVLIGNSLDQQTLLRKMRNDGRSTIAAFQKRCTGIQPQPSHEYGRLGAVARQAFFHQNRPNSPLEKLDLFRWDRCFERQG